MVERGGGGGGGVRCQVVLRAGGWRTLVFRMFESACDMSINIVKCYRKDALP